MRILNFGSSNIDYVYSLDHIVTAGETESTQKLEIFPGGKGLNQSIALAKAGVKVYHAGCIGNDGEMLIDVLKKNKVDISYIKKVNEKNGHAIIQINTEGENCIFIYPGSNEMVSTEFIDSVLENFSSGDVLLLQNEINNVNYIIQKAYQKQMCIIFNPSPINKKILEIDFNMLSYIILNEIEAKEISGCAESAESLKYFKKQYPSLKVMLTLGKKGCIYSDENCELHQSAFNVNVVDTTAAGDSFTGYFVAEISRGTDYAEILKISSAASAIAISRNGAAPSIPDRNEVMEELKNLKVCKLR